MLPKVGGKFKERVSVGVLRVLAVNNECRHKRGLVFKGSEPTVDYPRSQCCCVCLGFRVAHTFVMVLVPIKLVDRARIVCASGAIHPRRESLRCQSGSDVDRVLRSVGSHRNSGGFGKRFGWWMQEGATKGGWRVDVRFGGWCALTVAMVVTYILGPLSKEISLGRFG